MHVGAVDVGERVLVIDDVVATGGTLCAAIKLLERVGGDVVECACLIGLPKFKVLFYYYYYLFIYLLFFFLTDHIFNFFSFLILSPGSS